MLTSFSEIQNSYLSQYLIWNWRRYCVLQLCLNRFFFLMNYQNLRGKEWGVQFICLLCTREMNFLFEWTKDGNISNIHKGSIVSSVYSPCVWSCFKFRNTLGLTVLGTFAFPLLLKVFDSLKKSFTDTLVINFPILE